MTATATDERRADTVHLAVIDGERPPGEQTATPLIDPGDGQPIGAVAGYGAGAVDLAVRAARKALAGPWARLSEHERSRLLMRFADLVEGNAERLATIEATNAGKPIRDVRGYDLPRTIEHFHYFAGWPGKVYGETIPVPQEAVVSTRLRPVGVVGQIVPWNFPMMIAAWKVAPALAAGCAVVLKPAAETPLSALALAELALEAGIPPGAFNVVPGGAEVGAALAGHDDVDKVSFTGSTAVGREVVHASAGNLKRLSLELGGKNALIAFADASVDRVARAIVRGAFFHSGQVCVAASRVLLHRAIADAVSERVVALSQELRLGPVLDPATELGPLISARHHERVASNVAEARTDGVQLLSGGGRPTGFEAGSWFAPTVLRDDARAAAINRTEVFGPVLLLSAFDTEREAIDAANDTEYGLTAGVFTASHARAERVVDALHSATVWVNTFMQGDSAVPTGGWHQSGYGADRGRDALLGYTRKQVVWTAVDT